MTNEQDFIIINGVLTEYEGEGGEVVIPEGVAGIAFCAFEDCTGLTSLALPKSAVRVDPEAFYGCTGLTGIRVDPANPAYRSEDGLLLSRDGRRLCRCPEGRTGVVAVPEGVAGIGERAFAGCASLAEVTLPGSGTEIGENAFGGCPWQPGEG